MQLIKGINQAIYFLLELSLLGSLGYAGFHSNQHPYGKYLLAVGLPVLAAVLWGFFAAPRSHYRLEFPYRSLFALAMFGVAFYMLYQSGHTRLAIGLGITAILSEFIAFVVER